MDGAVRAQMEMKLCGLLAEGSLSEVMKKFYNVIGGIKETGCELKTPFSTLEFMFACGEIGFVKMCDLGLLDVDHRKIMNVVVD